MSAKHNMIAGLVAAVPWIEKKKRKASPHPLAERQFSMAKLNIPGFGAVSVIFIPVWFGLLIPEYQAGKEDIWYGIALIGFAHVFSIVGFLQGLFSRYGTKDGYVWYRFGKLIDKKIPYDQLERVGYFSKGYVLRGAGYRTRIASDMFDYSLAFIRILEELQYRRFTIYGTKPEEPYWETQAQEFREELFAKVYAIHQDYYEEHPEELEKLEALAVPPGTDVEESEADDGSASSPSSVAE